MDDLTGSASCVAGSEANDQAAAASTELGQVELNRLEKVVYRALVSAGTKGLTDDEIEIKTKLSHQSASARRRRLVLKGQCCDSGERRMTRTGRPAAIWIAMVHAVGLPVPAKPVRSVRRESKSSNGAALANIRRSALEQAIAICTARAAGHLNFPDRAEAEACAAAIRVLLND